MGKLVENSAVEELRQVRIAMELIELGARLQVLESETTLSRGRLIKLYKELRGVSPPKGMLPYSTDWFVTWEPNIHGSVFYQIYRRIMSMGECERMEAFVKAYRLYLEQMVSDDAEPVFSLTRAWTLLRFIDSGQLDVRTCTRCGAGFVAHAHAPGRHFVCGLCRPPSRAGRTIRKSVSTE